MPDKDCNEKDLPMASKKIIPKQLVKNRSLAWLDMDDIMEAVTLYKCRFCRFYCKVPSGIQSHCRAIHYDDIMKKGIVDKIKKSPTITKKKITKQKKMVVHGVPANVDGSYAVVDETDNHSDIEENTEGESIADKLIESSNKNDDSIDIMEYDELLLEHAKVVDADNEQSDQEHCYSSPKKTELDDSTEKSPKIKGAASDNMKDVKLFLCGQCALVFGSLAECKKHMAEEHDVHFSEKALPVLLPKGKNVRSDGATARIIKSGLKRMRNKSQGPVSCDICDKEFTNMKNLRKHVRSIHEGVKPESERVPKVCHTCKRSFANHKTLGKHIRQVHEGRKPHLCPICGLAIARSTRLAVHLRKHTGEKPLQCEFCSYATADPNNLRRHKLQHVEDKPYHCKFCSYECRQTVSLKAHLKKAHPDSGGIFTCGICNFQTVSQLTFSMHVHYEGEKPPYKRKKETPDVEAEAGGKKKDKENVSRASVKDKKPMLDGASKTVQQKFILLNNPNLISNINTQLQVNSATVAPTYITTSSNQLVQNSDGVWCRTTAGDNVVYVERFQPQEAVQSDTTTVAEVSNMISQIVDNNNSVDANNDLAKVINEAFGQKQEPVEKTLVKEDDQRKQLYIINRPELTLTSGLDLNTTGVEQNFLAHENNQAINQAGQSLSFGGAGDGQNVIYIEQLQVDGQNSSTDQAAQNQTLLSLEKTLAGQMTDALAQQVDKNSRQFVFEGQQGAVVLLENTPTSLEPGSL